MPVFLCWGWPFTCLVLDERLTNVQPSCRRCLYSFCSTPWWRAQSKSQNQFVLLCKLFFSQIQLNKIQGFYFFFFDKPQVPKVDLWDESEKSDERWRAFSALTLWMLGWRVFSYFHLLKIRGERCAYRFWYIHKGDLWLFSVLSEHELSIQVKWQVGGGESDTNIRDDFVSFFLKCHKNTWSQWSSLNVTRVVH